MKKMEKRDSEKIRKIAKKFHLVLEEMCNKYYDEEDGGPSADLYTSAYIELQKANDELSWWLC